MSNLNAIQGRYRGFAISAHLFDSLKIDDSEAYKGRFKTFPILNRDSDFNVVSSYRIDTGFSEEGSATPHVLLNNAEGPNRPSFRDNLKIKTNQNSPLGEGKTITVIQNFADAQSYMREITPIAIPSSFTQLAQIFKFKVSCPADEGIVLISPSYFVNTGGFDIINVEESTAGGYDFFNGIGGRAISAPTSGVYYNGEEVWLIIHKQDTRRFYGFIPVVDFKTPSYGNFNFTSVTTIDFEKYFGTQSAIDTKSDEDYTKRLEEQGGYEQ
jgi:hypothetical protein